jgi:outer membrane protein TolC
MRKYFWKIALLVVTSGCTSYQFEQNISDINTNTDVVFSGQITVVKHTDQQNALDVKAKSILENVVGEAEAVQLMLAKSPAFQKLLFTNLKEGSLAAQTGRIPNPTFAFERMVKGSETEYGRFLTFGLLDLLSLPSKQTTSKIAVEIANVNLASEILGSIMDVRLAWLDAVAAEEKFAIAEKTFVALSGSAELAKRMKQTGNMTTTDRIKEQLVYSESVISLAEAEQLRVSTRERLISLIGLNSSEAAMLSLPGSLPPLAEKPIEMSELVQVFEDRFDVKLARLDYELALAAMGIENVSTYTDLEIGIRNDRINDGGSISNKRGYELEVAIPVFDWGGAQRNALQAEVLVKQQNFKQVTLAAASGLRDAYNSYRTSFDIAQHYQEQIIPMHEVLLDEANYNYNGMIIGVFELLEAGREKSLADKKSIDANHNLLKAELNLRSSALGRSVGAETGAIATNAVKKPKGH